MEKSYANSSHRILQKKCIVWFLSIRKCTSDLQYYNFISFHKYTFCVCVFLKCAFLKKNLHESWSLFFQSFHGYMSQGWKRQLEFNARWWKPSLKKIFSPEKIILIWPVNLLYINKYATSSKQCFPDFLSLSCLDYHWPTLVTINYGNHSYHLFTEPASPLLWTLPARQSQPHILVKFLHSYSLIHVG